MDSLTFLQGTAKAKVRPIYVLHGDEHFLKRRVVAALRALVLGAEDDGFGLSSREGDKANWAEILDELETLPFLSERRLVVVERADPFVTRERSRLEKYFSEPAKTGVLVLEVSSWPASTKLAKLLPEAATIVCKSPESRKLPEWCVEWCAAQHGKPLSVPAARLLVDLVGADMGLLDQEMAKLAIYAGTNSRIDTPDVDQLVGQSRAENTWKIFDLIGAGQLGAALTLLDRLLDQGEEPLRLLGAFSMQLRRLAQAARLCSQGDSLPDALEHAGVPPFGRRNAEQQIRHLGRRRLDLIYDWLLDTDLGLKGSSQLPPRTLLQRLVAQWRDRDEQVKMSPSLPRLLFTLGDVAGIGPEIIVRAWPDLLPLCRPAIVGDPLWVRRGVELVGSSRRVAVIAHPAEAEADANVLPCLLGSDRDLHSVQPGHVSAAAGRAAYDFLCRAIDWTMAGDADGIVTAPLHKEGLHAAGLPYPGHTEILAERTGVKEFAMVLAVGDLAVAHVTLHMALREVFRHLTAAAVLEKARLLDGLLRRLLGRRPRLGVAALNPHASDGGLFGDEEATLIAPAVQTALREGIEISGPWPCDTLFVRARRGDFDGIVAMYHDQGHIALKLLGEGRAVNISAGLPIVRTSVAHGTAYDIAGRGIADAASLVEATRVASQLARTRK